MNDEFETAVTAALTGMAKVDPETIAQILGSIATLPDRNARRPGLFGLGRLRFGLFRPALALATVAALVAGLAGASLLIRMRGEAAPPIVATSPRPSPANPQTEHVVFTGPGTVMFGWSPDGSHFALGAPAVVDTATVHLFDRSGNEVQTVPARQFAWLGPDTFVILRYGEPWNDGSTGDAYLGKIGSPDLTKVAGNYLLLVAGPSGAVAMNLGGGVITADTRYVVWTGGGFTAPRDGAARQWSNDGTALAVMHYSVADQSVGSVEVVRPSGASVASVGQLASWGDFRFSPNGSSLAYTDRSYSTGTEIHVLNLQTASTVMVPLDTPSFYAWADGESLCILDAMTLATSSWSSATGRVTAFSSDSLRGASGRGVVATSGIGGSDELKLTFSTAGTTPQPLKVVVLGAPLAWNKWISDNYWSPDGKSVVLLSGDPNSVTSEMDALLVSW